MNIITKAYLKWLWLSKTYSFRWAHKPLCTHFKKDTISFGGIFLCRSCLFTYLGIITTAILTICFSESPNSISKLLVALLLITLPLSHPSIYKNNPRPIRDILRFNLGVIISFSLLLLIYHHEFFLPLSVVGISLIFWRFYYQKRSIRKIQFCEKCSEYRKESICSGYKFQVTLIREYEEKATEHMYKTTYIPKILQGKIQK